MRLFPAVALTFMPLLQLCSHVTRGSCAVGFDLFVPSTVIGKARVPVGSRRSSSSVSSEPHGLTMDNAQQWHRW
ncbi:hypothetical protein ABEF93_000915 [Exophiala dermatitidis]